MKYEAYYKITAIHNCLEKPWPSKFYHCFSSVMKTKDFGDSCSICNLVLFLICSLSLFFPPCVWNLCKVQLSLSFWQVLFNLFTFYFQHILYSLCFVLPMYIVFFMLSASNIYYILCCFLVCEFLCIHYSQYPLPAGDCQTLMQF